MPTKFTPETTATFLARFRNSGNATASADAAGIGKRTLFDWLEKGRSEAEEDGEYREFLAAFEKARGEMRDLRAARHYRVAFGGIERKPKCRTYTTEAGLEITTNEIERTEDGELQWVEYWREPDVKAMQWLMARDEPAVYGNPETTVNVRDSTAYLGARDPKELGAGLAMTLFGALEVLRSEGVLPTLPAIETQATATVDDPVDVAPTGRVSADTAPVEARPTDKPTPDDDADLL
jgi:hypothetical protein